MKQLYVYVFYWKMQKNKKIKGEREREKRIWNSDDTDFLSKKTGLMSQLSHYTFTHKRSKKCELYGIPFMFH